METIKNNQETNMLNHEIEASFILTAQSAGNLMSFDYSAWEKGTEVALHLFHGDFASLVLLSKVSPKIRNGEKLVPKAHKWVDNKEQIRTKEQMCKRCESGLKLFDEYATMLRRMGVFS